MRSDSQTVSLPSGPRGVQFSLASLLLTTLVVSICLAAARLDIQVGVVVSFLTIPALLRTAIVAIRRTRAGHSLTTRERCIEFLFSWAITFPIGIASLVVVVVMAGLGLGVAYLMSEFLGDDRPLSLLSPLLLAAVIAAPILLFALGIYGSLAYGPAKEGERMRGWRRLPQQIPDPYFVSADAETREDADP